MPTYEYLCESCGRFEVIHGIKEPALSACPKCKRPVTRLISAGAGFIFKGSGFYITDHRKPDYEKRQKEDEKRPGAASENTADSKTKTDGTKDPGVADKGVTPAKKDDPKTP